MAREVARLAREVQQEIEGLALRPTHSTDSTRSTESTDSVAQALGRIERKLGSVHGQTSELIRRVPKDLSQALAELRRALILRLEEAASANGSNDSTRSNGSDGSTRSARSPVDAAKSLTSQERKVFRMCFQSGFLSYGEIARQLEITPGAAKNLVNRIFQSETKRPLFAKRYERGSARVGIRPHVQEGILRGKAGGEEVKAKMRVSVDD